MKVWIGMVVFGFGVLFVGAVVPSLKMMLFGLKVEEGLAVAKHVITLGCDLMAIGYVGGRITEVLGGK